MSLPSSMPLGIEIDCYDIFYDTPHVIDDPVEYHEIENIIVDLIEDNVDNVSEWCNVDEPIYLSVSCRATGATQKFYACLTTSWVAGEISE